MTDEPQWRDRPTEPGMWVCVGGSSPLVETIAVLVLTAEDIERGAPFHCPRVYGPIPPDTTKKCPNCHFPYVDGWCGNCGEFFDLDKPE